MIHEHGYARVVTVGRKLPVSGEGIVVAATWGGSGSVSIGGISPLGKEGADPVHEPEYHYTHLET